MECRKYAGALALVSLLSTATTVDAAEPGFYVGAALGQAGHDVEPSDGKVFAFSSPFGGFVMPVQPDSIAIDSDELSWNAMLGYRVNAYFAAELAYMDFGDADVAEHYTISSRPSPFFPSEVTQEFSINVKGPALSILGSLPVGSGFDVFLRAGVLFADQKIDTGANASPRWMTFGSEVWLAGVGIDWSFAKRWAARIEYQRTGTIDSNIISGESELDQSALSVLFRL